MNLKFNTYWDLARSTALRGSRFEVSGAGPAIPSGLKVLESTTTFESDDTTRGSYEARMIVSRARGTGEVRVPIVPLLFIA